MILAQWVQWPCEEYGPHISRPAVLRGGNAISNTPERRFYHSREVLLRLGKLWVIDTDAGADDGVAISLLLAAEATSDFTLRALTVVSGNTQVDNVARNVLKILDTAKRIDIPVYKGSNYSILITPPSDNFFGEDGFGDFEYPNPPPEGTIHKEHAVSFLVNTVRENPGKISLLAIGPLTNIALAIRMDAQFLENLDEIVILGGAIEGRGNIKPGVEFNIYVDPEAAFIVFDEAERKKKTIRLVSWEVVLQIKISMEWRKLVLGSIETPVIELLNKAERMSTQKGTEWYSSDTIATLWMMNNSMPHSATDYNGKVEVCGMNSRGATIVDYQHDSKEYKQLKVLKPGSLDDNYVKHTLTTFFSSYNPKN